MDNWHFYLLNILTHNWLCLLIFIIFIFVLNSTNILYLSMITEFCKLDYICYVYILLSRELEPK